MFREMRRKNQLLPAEESISILEKASSGVLSLLGDEGYPYGVPLSYVYLEGRLLFHGATVGHKIDALRRCEKASFCVIDRDEVKPELRTTWYRSVIAFGKVSLLEGEEKRRALEAIGAKYSPQDPEGCRKEIEESFDHTAIICLEIEHLSGKAAKALV